MQRHWDPYHEEQHLMDVVDIEFANMSAYIKESTQKEVPNVKREKEKEGGRKHTRKNPAEKGEQNTLDRRATSTAISLWGTKHHIFLLINTKLPSREVTDGVHRMPAAPLF